MPGKVNPVIAESAIMAACQVIANDLAVTLGGMGGQFELNTMLPLVAWNLLESIDLLAASARNVDVRLVGGLGADRERIARMIEDSLALATALAPALGYDAAAAIAREAAAGGRTVREVAAAKGVLAAAEIDRLLDARAMTRGGIPGSRAGTAG